MTEERLSVAELLEKAGGGHFLRAVAEAVLQLLMETDVEGLIGAGRYERSGERTTLAQRSSRPHPRHPARGTAAAHSEIAARQLFPTVSGGPQELGEGADRSDPGGLDRWRLDPAGRRSGASNGAVGDQQVASFQAL